MPDTKFNIFSGALKALDISDDGKKRLTTTASSDIEDLAGDRMTQKALESMARTAERGMTIFLNHSYRVPEDVLGSVETASLQARGDSVDLDFQIRVEEANPRAVKAWEMIQSGTQLGCSIGALIPEGGAKRSDKGLIIDDVHLLEASIVGIPANPRAFAHYAAKSFYESEQSDDDGTELVEAAVKGAVEGIANGLPVDTAIRSPLTSSNLTTNSANTNYTVHSSEPPAEKTSEELAPERNENEPNDGPVATSPSTLTDEADAPPEGDKGAAADTESADVPTTQEAPTSDPETEGDEDDTTDAIASKSIGVLRELLRSTSRDLSDTRKALSNETEKRLAAEGRADDAEDNLKVAREIIEGIATLPMGRRTHFAKHVSDFRTKLGGIYGDDVLKLVEKQNGN